MNTFFLAAGSSPALACIFKTVLPLICQIPCHWIGRNSGRRGDWERLKHKHEKIDPWRLVQGSKLRLQTTQYGSNWSWRVVGSIVLGDDMGEKMSRPNVPGQCCSTPSMMAMPRGNPIPEKGPARKSVTIWRSRTIWFVWEKDSQRDACVQTSTSPPKKHEAEKNLRQSLKREQLSAENVRSIVSGK